MKKSWKKLAALVLSAAMVITGLPVGTSVAKAETSKPANWVTPVEKYGDLSVGETTVDGTTIKTLVDKSGNPVQLKGMSTFGLQWGDGSWVIEDANGNKNDAAFDALAYDWQCDIIRLAMYVTEGGYATNPEVILSRVEKGIDMAIERGMYVLIDWHILNEGSNDPNAEVCMKAGENLAAFADIKAAHPDYRGPQLFFAYLSQKYGAYPNVIFETANEPNGNGSEDAAADVWKTKLLPYHQSVVDAIRLYDNDQKDNIVVCGTDNWSQYVDAPIGNPVMKGENQDMNVMYTMHFYAGTHDVKVGEDGEYWLGSKVINALTNGIPVFVTEWGTSESTGNGGPYINYTNRWMEFMDKYNLSWCSWSLAQKNEVSASMKKTTNVKPTDTDGDGIPNWDNSLDIENDDLSITGRYVRAMIRGDQAPMFGKEEMIDDFENTPKGDVASDSPQPIALSVVEVADGDHAFSIGQVHNEAGVWGNDDYPGGPRVKFGDLGNVYSLYNNIVFDVYLPKDTELVNGELEIQPVIQTANNGWWKNSNDIKLKASDFSLDSKTGLMKATAKSNFESVKVPEDKLGHITLLIGDTAGFYMDNLRLESLYNGDIKDAPVIPDKPGKFQGLPFDFEEGGRQGWAPDDVSQIDYLLMGVTELFDGDNAMYFPMSVTPGKNKWEDGVRISSPMNKLGLSYEEDTALDAIAMNVYIEKGKASTGKLELEICGIPDGDGWWYQSGKVEIDPINGGQEVTSKDGKELLKFYVYCPLNKEADNYGQYPFSNNVPLRNIILALHGADCDFDGMVYYDNIRPVDAQNLDDIDTEINKAYDAYFSKTVDKLAIPMYSFIDGENQKIKAGDDLTVHVDGQLGNFDNVSIDGVALEKGVTTKSGSTIATVAADALAALKSGKHTIRVNFKDGGYAETSFDYEAAAPTPGDPTPGEPTPGEKPADPTPGEKPGDATPTATPVPTDAGKPADTTPKTGDSFNPFMAIMMLIMGGAACAYATYKRREFK